MAQAYPPYVFNNAINDTDPFDFTKYKFTTVWLNRCWYNKNDMDGKFRE